MATMNGRNRMLLSLDAHLVATLVEEDDALVKARESGRLTTMPTAEVAPNQGKLLALLAQVASATRVLEFGTLAGYRTIWLARAVGTGAYDFVFIDADKPSNPEYLRAALKLSHPGSVIVIDNVVRNGTVIDADSQDERVRGVRAALDDIAKDPRLEATSLQTVGLKGWDGFTLIRRAG